MNTDTLRLIAWQIDDPLTWRAFALVNKKTGQIARELMSSKQDQFVKRSIVIGNGGVEYHYTVLPNGDSHGIQKITRNGRDEGITTYARGRKHGKHIRYTSFGQLIEISEYKNGDKVSIEYLKAQSIYQDDGQLSDFCNGNRCSFNPSCKIRHQLIKEIEGYQWRRPG